LTISYLGNGSYQGLSSDTKPTNVPINAFFYETDTFTYWVSDGVGGWKEKSNVDDHTYTIYTTGSIYKVKNNTTGLVVSSSTTCETVFQYALDNGLRSSIYVQAGSYNFSGAFAGLTISQNETTIILSPGALLTVPAGYTGNLWIFTQNTSGSRIDGGKYSETPTISRLWTFAHLETAEGFLTYHKIMNCYVRFCGKFIEYKNTGTAGWINGNIVEDCFVDQFTQGIVWTQTSTLTGSNGINRNDFRNVILQSYSGSTDGIINISGISNMFIDCKVWDMPAGGHGVTISSGGTDTIFIGGIIASAIGFSDSGVRTKIIENNNTILPNLQATNITFAKMTPPSTPSTNTIGVYVDTADTHLKQKDSVGGVFDISGMIGPVRGRKMGRYDGSNSTNQCAGIFSALTTMGTLTGVQTSTANGNSCRYTSGAVAGNAAGHKFATAYTTRAWNPYLGVRFKLGTATNNRVFIGWNNGVDPAASTEDPLSGVNGVMLVQRSTDTTFQISANNGTTSTFTSTGVTVDNTSVFTIEFRADAANNKFQWSLNGSTWADIAGVIPASTSYLAYTAHIQTAEAVAHTIDIFATETVSDK
jgi:hypothetical protein